MLDENYWNKRWKDGRIGFHQSEINPYLTEFWPELELAEGSKVFVPLCGKSRDMCWLAEQGYLVTGVEFSEQAVQEYFELRGETTVNSTVDRQHQRYSSGSCLDVFVGDFFGFQPEQLYDAVYDRAALVAISPELRQAYVERLSAMVKKGGKALLVSLEFTDDEHKGPPFSVEQDEIGIIYGTSWSIKVLKIVNLGDKKREVCYKLVKV